MSLVKFSSCLKKLTSRSSSLLLLLQRAPIVHYFLPEAGVLGGSSLVGTVPLAITTVAGLGAYDSVSGATTISQAAPVSGSTKIPSAQALDLNNVFNVVGAGGHTPKSWAIIGTPTDSPGDYPITIKAWENKGFSGRSASKAFTVSVLGFIIHPASAVIPSGTTTTLTSVVAGNPTGATLTYNCSKKPARVPSSTLATLATLQTPVAKTPPLLPPT